MEEIVKVEDMATPAPTKPPPNFENFPMMPMMDKEKRPIKNERPKISEPKNVDDINKMSMQELKDFIEKNSVRPKTERPTTPPPPKDKIEIKEGMLFKNGMTMKEIKADNMGMSVKELIGKEEGLRMREINEIEEGVTVEEGLRMREINEIE